MIVRFLRPAAVLALLASAGCSPAPPPRGPYTIINGDPRRNVAVPDVSQSEWTLSRERLARMRSELPRKPYVERIQIGVVDPRSGKLFQARGAVLKQDRGAAVGTWGAQQQSGGTVPSPVGRAAVGHHPAVAIPSHAFRISTPRRSRSVDPAPSVTGPLRIVSGSRGIRTTRNEVRER